ncbi:NAD(P)/FAD-dependent oxidoreductase [Sphingomonas lycopersici]|uniref:FAD-dependent monooxygenase n=1 Tax=Sphingomonas lycopersici TaxID=2951807 RepID=A0AA41ZCR5_9SPHN|nr:FAD-dependent monooxygenase [Sphingomonas lycopersici]MCW6536952.1 FAD-dependent monooxygenase [Sphingomonas lycopersici]
MSERSALVVGGGPAGAATAIHLARCGVTPLVIERNVHSADALCGGFLSWRTLDFLAGLGITRAMLGGHEINRIRLIAGAAEYSAALPISAMGVSRRHLDTLLLNRARGLGAQVRYGAARFDNGRIILNSGEVFAAGSIFLATGKHDLRGLARPHAAAGADPMVGLRWRVTPSTGLRAVLDGQIELHLFPGGYAGMTLHEDGSANLCLAVRKSRLTMAQGSPAILLTQLAETNPHFGSRCADIAGEARFDAIGHLPYHWRALTGTNGIFRVGDQAGVIASLAGEGIGIALASAAEAVACWRDGGAAAAPMFQRRFAARLARPIRAARFISMLSGTRVGAHVLGNLSHIPGAFSWMASATRV